METDFFSESQADLAYARERLKELFGEMGRLFADKPWSIFSEIDRDTGEKHHKVRLNKPLPRKCPNVAFEIISHCRAILDRIGYTMALASGVAHPTQAHFPFGQDINDVLKKNGPNGKSSDIPKDIFLCMASFQPYPGGNDLLVAINKACNAAKHTLLSPQVLRLQGGLSFTEIEGVINKLSFPIDAWDASKSELTFLITPPDYGAEHKVKLSFSISFGDIFGIKGLPLFPVLDEMIQMTEAILAAIEMVSHRIGLIS